MSLKNLIDKAFGHTGQEVRGNEILYYCPGCNHHKPKLSINLETHCWKCWVCGKSHGTTGKSIRTLFKLLKVPKRFYDELERYAKSKVSYKKEDVDEILRLPEEFLPLWKDHHNFEHNHALHYLKKRGIKSLEILKYGMGYCREGDYKNRIIIPSFDDNGDLNYFISRTWVPDHPLKYKNPKVSKNVIGFEMFINWDINVTLCEGVFDAIAIRRNAIPLFGKSLNDKLKLKLISKHPPMINVVLDGDAQTDAICICKELIQCGLTVRNIKLNNQDPSDIGYKKIHKIMNQSTEFGFIDDIRQKLGSSNTYN